jgi:hypothetical protein
MSHFVCNPQELQRVKDELDRDINNHGVGILHEPTGQIYLAPFDDVPNGHDELVAKWNLPASECKGFAIMKQPDGTFIPLNSSHLNGPQGQPGSLTMPLPTFSSIVQALQAAGL